MKSNFAIFGMVLTLLANGLVPAFAHAGASGYRPAKGYRYRVTYREWDRAIYHQYGYQEESCQVTYTFGGSYYTCYEMAPTDYLYVEEQHMSGGYTRVTVYRDEYGYTPYAHYYVYENRVHYREFYGHHYYRDVYYSPYYPTYSYVWVSLNWNNGWDKVIIGSYTALVGADILAGAKTDAEFAVGGAIMLLGSASIASGAHQLHEESELQKRIKQERKDSGDLK